ncbi:hypothetical protein [Oceanobacillus jeddahense]|uniref:DUF5590 domain-containing protein n=1 Tax=Oceanobacillus jeddahense TaxID=1462527 RepID=A0ABY5JN17_9BACI|nr:hypothetical protein [Oceanobacillus jeddahense]UUI01697.1 hypothetical protein NP439_16800 [Oceanobacillus jeddahense]
MKRFEIWGSISVLIILVLAIFFWYMSQLEEDQAMEITKTVSLDDLFLLHIQFSGEADNIQVKCSLQYIGEEEVTIQHQTPLVSLSAHEDVHRVTGGYVYRTLHNSDIYYQPNMEIEDVEFEDGIIYFQVRYQMNGEEKVFTFEEEINLDM